VLLGAAALLLGVGVYWLGTRARSEEKPVTFRRITFRRGDVAEARFTPDGESVVYSAAFDGGPMEVYLTRWDGHDARPLGMPAMRLAGVSRTGELAVVRDNGHRASTLARISLAGSGTPRDVLAGVSDAAWGPDGELAVVRESKGGEYQLEYPIGRVIVRIPHTLIYFPRVSPQGDRIAFHIEFAKGEPEIRVADLQGNMVTLIKSFGVGHPVWSPDGKQVFFSADVSPGNSSIHAATRQGRIRTVLANSQEFEVQDVSRDGKVLVHDNLVRGALIFGDLGSGRVRDLSWLDGSMLEDLSADGGRILFSELVHGSGSRGDVFVRKPDGSPALRLGDGEPLTLSPDGEWVSTRSSDLPRKLILLPTGAGEVKTVPLGDIDFIDATFVPGSRRIAVLGTKPGASQRIFLMDWEGRGVRVVGPEDPTTSPRFSPDGKRAVILSEKSGYQLWSLDGGVPTDLPGIVGSSERVISWSDDARLLYVRSLWVLPVEISRYEIATGRRTAWQKLEPVDPAGVDGLQRALVSSDGRHYAYSYWTKTKSDLYVIDRLQARLW